MLAKRVIALSPDRAIGKQIARFFVTNDGSNWKLDDDVIAVLARTIGAHAVLSAAGAPLALKLEVVESVQASRSDDVDRSAGSSVAARGTAFGDVLLAAERHTPIPTVAGFHADSGLVDEH